MSCHGMALQNNCHEFWFLPNTRFKGPLCKSRHRFSLISSCCTSSLLYKYCIKIWHMTLMFSSKLFHNKKTVWSKSSIPFPPFPVAESFPTNSPRPTASGPVLRVSPVKRRSSAWPSPPQWLPGIRWGGHRNGRKGHRRFPTSNF